MTNSQSGLSWAHYTEGLWQVEKVKSTEALGMTCLYQRAGREKVTDTVGFTQTETKS